MTTMPATEARLQNLKRTRKGSTKSRHGCLTCKIRHIKCDESRPYCRRCSSTGRHCEGFVDGQTFQFAPPSLISSFSSTTEILITEKESHYLNVFRHVSVASISGYHRWTSLILQAMHEEPAVRHAAIAFAALQLPSHESTIQNHPIATDPFALQQYGKSMKAFQELLNNHDRHSISAALVCSIICIAFEVIDGSHIQAQQHLENGLRILRSIHVDGDIMQAFARLDVQASTYLGMRTPEMASPLPLPNATVFINLDDAKESFYQEMSYMWSFLRNRADDFRYREPDDIPLHLLVEAEAIKLNLERWNAAFSLLIEGSQTMMPPREAQQAKLLQIHHDTATIMMTGSLHAEEMAYDACHETFERIVRLSTEIHYDSCTSPLGKAFSIDMGLIHPLFVTATKCRVVHIRQKAAQLLEVVPICEGVWNGQLMAKIAWQVKGIEEDGLDESFLRTQAVPEFRRVHSVDMSVDPKARHASVSYRLRPNGMDGEWEDRENFVTW